MKADGYGMWISAVWTPWCSLAMMCQMQLPSSLPLGPAGEVFREAGEEAEYKRPQTEAALAKAINAQKLSADGIVMDSSSWMISATNPVV